MVRALKAMAPVCGRLAAEFEPDVRFLKVDTEAEPELSARYNIRSIPTLILFRDGKVAARQSGALGAEALRSWLRQRTRIVRGRFSRARIIGKSGWSCGRERLPPTRMLPPSVVDAGFRLLAALLREGRIVGIALRPPP